MGPGKVLKLALPTNGVKPHLRVGALTGSLLQAKSLSAVSEAPPSEERGVETLSRGRFRYSDLKEAAPRDYGICIWMGRS